jgi:hypothetical protein
LQALCQEFLCTPVELLCCAEIKFHRQIFGTLLVKNVLKKTYVFRPTKLGTIGPGFCNNTWHFNFAELTPIRKELDEKWTNIENGTAEDSLWKHEWQKHGTCAAQLPSLNTELKYFSKGIEWFDLHDMSSILAQSGIVPMAGKSYNVQEISDAVKGALGTNVGVECWKDPVSKIFKIRTITFIVDYFVFRKPKLPTYLKSESATVKIWVSLTAMASRRAPTASAI